MPYILKHQASGHIYTCMLVNNYRLAYYGTKYWEELEDAEREYADFLALQGIEAANEWSLLELTENQLKLCNVKLKNDPRLSLRWNEESQTALAEPAANNYPLES